jgi:hypothetical protein
MNRRSATTSKRAQDAKAREGEQAEGSAILHSVAIVTDKRFRLDIDMRHPR